MAKQVQIRGDSNSNILATVLAARELGVNTTNKRLHIGDGATAGGIIVPNAYDVQKNSFSYSIAGGTADVITVTLDPVPDAYTTGMSLRFKAVANNTGSTTINVNSLGAKNLYKKADGLITALEADDIINGGMFTATYDGTQFQLEGQVGASSGIEQGDISTSTGEVSHTTSSKVNYALPGGEYGFYPVLKADNNNPTEAMLSEQQSSGNSGTYRSQIGFYVPGADNTIYAKQRYVTASPPFDLGDGEMGGFIFLLLNSSGVPVAHYSADVPPWAYNGPTSIRCDHQCPVTHKKFRKVMATRSLEEIMDGAKIIYEYEEITQKIKNADMNLIPSPFLNSLAGHTVVLLDPMDERLRKLVEYQNAGSGDDIISAIYSGKIYADNEALDKRKGPSGIMQARLRFKYSGK